jgi:hypothetical protein
MVGILPLEVPLPLLTPSVRHLRPFLQQEVWSGVIAVIQKQLWFSKAVFDFIVYNSPLFFRFLFEERHW